MTDAADIISSQFIDYSDKRFLFLRDGSKDDGAPIVVSKFTDEHAKLQPYRTTAAVFHTKHSTLRFRHQFQTRKGTVINYPFVNSYLQEKGRDLLRVLAGKDSVVFVNFCWDPTALVDEVKYFTDMVRAKYPKLKFCVLSYVSPTDVDYVSALQHDLGGSSAYLHLLTSRHMKSWFTLRKYSSEQRALHEDILIGYQECCRKFGIAPHKPYGFEIPDTAQMQASRKRGRELSTEETAEEPPEVIKVPPRKRARTRDNLRAIPS